MGPLVGGCRLKVAGFGEHLLRLVPTRLGRNLQRAVGPCALIHASSVRPTVNCRPTIAATIPLSFLLATPASAQDVPRLAIACQVRDAPSYRGPVVGELPAGAAPETRGRADRWVRIVFEGRYAYVGFACFATAAEAEMLARLPAPPASAASSAPPAGQGAGTQTSCPVGRPLIRGPRGGCYYVTDSGRRNYVDRGCCV